MKEFIEKLIGRLEEKANQTWLVLAERNGYERAIEIVNQLAEEYKGTISKTENVGWIPCSERLPEVSGEYYTYVYYDGHYMYSVDEIDCDGIIKEWNCSPDYQIIAWKPIAHYQPKGE